jgi:predicted Zn finger-like uncharacterized protein
MIIEITCPNCNFSKRIPREKIPQAVKWVNCLRCKSRFEFPFVAKDSGIEPEEIATGPEKKNRTEAPPWERRSDVGMWRGIHETFSAVLLSPRSLFGKMPFKDGLKEPLAYGLLLGSLGTMFGIFWQFLMTLGGLLAMAEGFVGPFGIGVLFLVVIVLSPFFVLAGIFFTSGVAHLLLLVVRGGGSGFEATFRVVAYSQATQILGLIPFIGGVVGGCWMLVVLIIGLKEIHETSYLRVLIAFLLPLALVFLLILAIVVPLLVLK